MPFKPPYAANFVPGDLVYGLHEHRSDWMQRQGQTGQQINAFFDQDWLVPSSSGSSTYSWTIDQINNSFLGTGWDPHPTNVYDPQHQPSYPPAQEFKSHLESHPRYNPRDIPESFHVEDRIRRACKAGIEWTAQRGGMVHFLLRGVDMNMVVFKIGPRDQDRMVAYQSSDGTRKTVWISQRSVTGAELRWIFRHRTDPMVALCVQFWWYRDATPTEPDDYFPGPPPWEASVDAQNGRIWQWYHPSCGSAPSAPPLPSAPPSPAPPPVTYQVASAPPSPKPGCFKGCFPWARRRHK